jgi:hypothetical protein
LTFDADNSYVVDAEVSASQFVVEAGTVAVSGAGATLDTQDITELGGAAAEPDTLISVAGGADVSATNFVVLGGALSVLGNGTTLQASTLEYEPSEPADLLTIGEHAVVDGETLYEAGTGQRSAVALTTIAGQAVVSEGTVAIFGLAVLGVDGAGTRLDASGDLSVGYATTLSGNAELQIDGGATVTVGGSVVAGQYLAGEHGTITVIGAGSALDVAGGISLQALSDDTEGPFGGAQAAAPIPFMAPTAPVSEATQALQTGTDRRGGGSQRRGGQHGND